MKVPEVDHAANSNACHCSLPATTTHAAATTSNTTVKRDAAIAKVQILECGYRHVWIAKSARQFPAWKVHFPSGSLLWRSKLDFWRLARSLSTHNGSGRTKIVRSFPKAAFHKLVQQAPWRPPNDDTDGVGDDGVYPINNNWKPFMQKSLLCLNQFLQQMQELAIHQPDDCPTVTREWAIFAREADTENLLACGSANPENKVSALSTITTTSLHQGKLWGQYFCSESNAQQLVGLFLDRVFAFAGAVDEGHDDVVKKQPLYIVEPSCGHGDVIRALLPCLMKDQAMDISILGMDIDPYAIDFCRAQVKMTQTSSTTIQWKHTDFLATRRAATIPAPNARVVMLGGPPYTNHNETTNGNVDESDNQQQDLATAFVGHAVTEYQARVIAFIMPTRCHPPAIIPLGYSYECVPLERSDFRFQGQEQQTVTQPSIIQCFWKREK